MTEKTICEIIESVDSNEILLPAMQRKFVWREEKILHLFDSIMKGYPFGTLIFWNIQNRQEIKKYRFYKFIKDWSEQDGTINAAAGLVAKNKIDVVMDGQQRLTSLYIGIKGSLTTISKYKKRHIAENWKRKHLYIAPHISLDQQNDDEPTYRFAFLEDAYVEKWNAEHNPQEQYYRVADFYDQTAAELRSYLNVGRLPSDPQDWRCVLNTLRIRLNEEKIIYYSVVQNADIADILEIFTRINNGGTQLSPSNLLFSTVITAWEKGREEMDQFINAINKEGILQLREDFLIRTCVYLVNQPASVKIELLTENVINEIKENWDGIKDAIVGVKNFLKKHNIAHDVILSYNSLMPIIYYFYHVKNVNDVAIEELFKFFAISQMFSLFGGNSTTTLDRVRKNMCDREVLGKIKKPFKMEYLKDVDLSAGRTNAFCISKQQVEKLVDTVHYGDSKAYIMLCLLQQEIRVTVPGNSCDVDHVCSKDELKKMFSYKKGELRDCLESMKNGLPNLQLLNYSQNRGDKNKDTLYTWVVEKNNSIKYDPFQKKKDKSLYLLKDIDTFKEFYSGRRALMIQAICKELVIT